MNRRITPAVQVFLANLSALHKLCVISSISITEPDEFMTRILMMTNSDPKIFVKSRSTNLEEDLARGEGFFIDDSGNWIPQDNADCFDIQPQVQ